MREFRYYLSILYVCIFLQDPHIIDEFDDSFVFGFFFFFILVNGWMG